MTLDHSKNRFTFFLVTIIGMMLIGQIVDTLPIARLIISGIATLVFGLSRSFALSVAALVVAGMADQVSMVTRATILQLSTPDGLRGRVSAVNMIFIGASNELGAAESGFLAALTNATFSVVAGGLACLGVLGIVHVRVPELQGYRISDDPNGAAP